MSTISMYLDLVEGAGGADHIIQGNSFRRLATLSNVPGDLDTGTLLQNAINFVYANVGGLGSACPNVAKPNFLESVEPESLSTDIVKLRLNYKGFPNLQIEIGTVLSTVRSNTDNMGNPITVTYQYSADKLAVHPEIIADDSSGNVSQGGFIDRVVQDTTFTLKYTVVGSSGVTASSKVLNFAQKYVGMVNKYVWASAPGAARCWLCESVRAISRDSGRTYEMVVSFHYRVGPIGVGESGSMAASAGSPAGPSGGSSAVGLSTLPGGWDFLVMFQDPYSGSGFVKDPVAGKTYKMVRGYKEGILPIMPPPGVSY